MLMNLCLYHYRVIRWLVYPSLFCFSLQFEPYIQEGNEGFVHHFLVYECHGDFNDTHYGPGWDCMDGANMPPVIVKCFFNNVLAVWGVGGEVRVHKANLYDETSSSKTLRRSYRKHKTLCKYRIVLPNCLEHECNEKVLTVVICIKGEIVIVIQTVQW